MVAPLLQILPDRPKVIIVIRLPDTRREHKNGGGNCSSDQRCFRGKHGQAAVFVLDLHESHALYPGLATVPLLVSVPEAFLAVLVAEPGGRDGVLATSALH